MKNLKRDWGNNMTDLNWPEGATHRIHSDFTKWVDGVEYVFRGGGRWVESSNSWSLAEYKSKTFEVIERPIDPPYVPKVGDRCHYELRECGVWWTCRIVSLNGLVIEKEGDFLMEIIDTTTIKFRPIKTESEEFIEKAAKVLQKDDQDMGHLCNKSVEMFHSAAKALLVAGFKAPEYCIDITKTTR
jgi:hypothetical protein